MKENTDTTVTGHAAFNWWSEKKTTRRVQATYLLGEETLARAAATDWAGPGTPAAG